MPSAGGIALIPVVQIILVELLLVMVQAMPSIETEIEEPKLLPWMFIEVLPAVGPNLGVIDRTVEVADGE